MNIKIYLLRRNLMFFTKAPTATFKERIMRWQPGELFNFRGQKTLIKLSEGSLCISLPKRADCDGLVLVSRRDCDGLVLASPRDCDG